MPWASTERKEREHSRPVRDRYAQAAQAHREALHTPPDAWTKVDETVGFPEWRE